MLLVLIIAVCGYSQTDEEYIEQIRDEIRVIQKRISESETGKRDVVQQLTDLNRQLELRSRLINEIQTQIRQSNNRLNSLDKNISELDGVILQLSNNLQKEELELNKLRHQTGERIALLYKHMRGLEVALLFSSTSLNDLFERQQYLKAVGKYDQSRIERLKTKRDEVAASRLEREEMQNKMKLEKLQRIAELDKLRSLLNQRREEEAQITQQRKQKQSVLDKISGDTELLNALLEERRRALQQIENEINRLENRAEVFPDLLPNTPFGTLSGKLPWPVKNQRVTSPFGRVTHPKLGTSIINPGIDVEAKKGDPVIAVAYGKVTRISYLRGFGNTIIISHGDGYYSVYARVTGILVNEGEIVSPGQIISEVGEVGVEGDFHFEIWLNRQTLNPLQWLKR